MVGSGRSGMPDGTRVLDRMRELDARKAAAGKQAQDVQLAGRREVDRIRKRAWRAKQKTQAVTIKDVACEPESALSDKQKTELFSQLFDVPMSAPSPRENKIRGDLLKLSRDRKAPASARVTALRTLAEMDGHIGRLQKGGADTADQPLATMTRAQLEDELRRLRAQRGQDAGAK